MKTPKAITLKIHYLSVFKPSTKTPNTSCQHIFDASSSPQSYGLSFWNPLPQRGGSKDLASIDLKQLQNHTGSPEKLTETVNTYIGEA